MSGAKLVSATIAGLLLLAQTAMAVAADIPTIRVGWTIPNEEAKYLMMRRPELFPDLGRTYKIDWIQFQGTSPMVQAMVAGALDCSTQAPLSLALGAEGGGLKAYIVAQHSAEKPGYFSVYWAVKKDSPIKTIADLKGKTIGVNVYGAGINAPMLMLLKKNGIDPDADVKFVETGFPGSADAVRLGRVDAGVLVQPFAAQAEAAGDLRKLFSVSDQSANLVEIFDACSTSFVDAHPDLAHAYVNDISKSMKLVLSDRDQTLKVDSEVMRVPVAVLDTFLLHPGKDAYRQSPAIPDLDGIQNMLDIDYAAGLTKTKVDVNAFIRKDIMTPSAP
jgi:ABC-type nitrate/sulfonate/bicarbonate transport system substrate-binding protein